MSNIHFLDSNVIVRSRKTWDKTADAIQYMKDKSVKRYTCEKVCSEVSIYFKRTRGIIIAFLKRAGDNVRTLSKAATKEDIEKWAGDIKVQRRYTDEDRIWQSLLKFIGAKIDDILFHVNGGTKQVEIYKEQVVNEWEAAFVTLRQDCRHDDDAPITLTYGCPVDHKTTRQYAAISEVVTNEDDIKILFDSYFIKLEKAGSGDIYFVTYDYEDIICHKSVIEAVFDGIKILTPVYC